MKEPTKGLRKKRMSPSLWRSSRAVCATLTRATSRSSQRRAVHEEFVKEYLGKTDSALQTYYRSLVFTGKASMPKVFGTAAEVVAYVAKTKGTIDYVSSGTATTGVKTLEAK